MRWDPWDGNYLWAGGYDEGVRVFDVRRVGGGKEVGWVEAGGGVWRGRFKGGDEGWMGGGGGGRVEGWG